ncbi:MAG TPA: farnesyl diphosphate synthase [Methylophilaceae bacterium]|nr:farnesyl diphosphate synthase [Methylophilaceae bacterium]
MSDFQHWAGDIQQRMELVLDSLLPSPDIAPQRLHEAMRYASLGGGKRVRALLAHAAGEFCGTRKETVEAAAAAVELIHAYSLVHDDMPCMDDDDLRRGKPSCHKQYDETIALLVGDTLQTLAFQILSAPGLLPKAEHQLEMVQLLAVASGSRGMAGGQAIDLASVGKNLTQTELEYMHIHKTGALIRAAALLGAYGSESPEPARIQAVDTFAQSIGLAFQVVDDILDAEADTATLGKTAGKDADANKPTYVTILGLKRARDLAAELHATAIESLMAYGSEAERLRQLAHYITQRSF